MNDAQKVGDDESVGSEVRNGGCVGVFSYLMLSRNTYHILFIMS